MPFITARVISVIRTDAIAALAFAGNNQSVLCASVVQLGASIIGDDIENHTFEWEQTSGTPVTLINPNTLTPSFVNPQISDLVFTFYLDRNTPYEDSDTVLITRSPESAMTTFSGATASTARTGTATAQSNFSGTTTELLTVDLHIAGSGYNYPPESRYSPIYKAEDLDRVRQNLLGAYWLMNDIDLSDYPNWNPIGTANKPFIGELQGNGFKIENLTITSSTKDAGIFSYIGSGALIEKVGITNANISGVGSGVYKAILAGGTSGIITVRDCYTEGTVASGGDLAGGLIGNTGSNASSVYDNTYADVTVTGGGADAGGWAGTFSATPTYIENYSNTTKTASIVGTGTPGATEVSGLSTAQLTAEANFTGWDFTDTWEIDEGVTPPTMQFSLTDNVRKGGYCDDQWMLYWENPPYVGSYVYPPTYMYKGAIIEENVGGRWTTPRFIPVERNAALMTPATSHRITTVWDIYYVSRSQLFNTPTGYNPVKEVSITDDRLFTSKETSSSFGPYAITAAGHSFSGSDGQVSGLNLSITISNPRKISMQPNDLSTHAFSGSVGQAVLDFATLRVTPIQMAENDLATHAFSGSVAQASGLNLSVTRVNGISI